MSQYPILQGVTLLLLGFIAGGINAVAGGGSFISFPALATVFHLPLVRANATNSVALWPGSIAGAFAYRAQLAGRKSELLFLVFPTFIGSLLGAILLLKTDNKTFGFLVPWLIGTAAMAMYLQPVVKRFVTNEDHELHPYLGWFVQFLVALYGGYFGAGMGIMMLAVFAFTIRGTIHELNGIKNTLAVVINFTASVYFTVKHDVEWSVAVWLLVGSLIGGFVCGKYSQRIPENKLRPVIATYGLVMALYFAYTVYLK